MEPLCEKFGQCGGCAYQDLPYTEELSLKLGKLKDVLRLKTDLPDGLFHPVTASP
ncbi:MAG TPA: 23S rRNA (uracil-5-)-methyltransferase RumA, partial [Candidatus Omnitrophica bacterium]|nr:23S rRNA (uracil-5-)-methyltransferase RumA [Candidatus Omnitrophota bacterium]